MLLFRKMGNWVPPVSQQVCVSEDSVRLEGTQTTQYFMSKTSREFKPELLNVWEVSKKPEVATRTKTEYSENQWKYLELSKIIQFLLLAQYFKTQNGQS